MKRLVALVIGLALIAAACSSATDEGGDGDDLSTADPGDCIVVDMASSPEKIDLMTELAKEFNGSDQAKVGDKCVFVRPQSKASGAGAAAALRRLARARRERPAAGDLVAGGERVGRSRQPAADRHGRAADHRAGEAVHAHAARDRDAQADGRGARLPGTSRSAGPTSSRLANDPQGWAAFGHPEWGPFRLGKTNPNFSTSGLNVTDRPVLRGHRQDAGPHARGPRQPRRRGVRARASSRRSCTTATRR